MTDRDDSAKPPAPPTEALEAQIAQYARQLADVQAQLAKIQGAQPPGDAPPAPNPAALDETAARLERLREAMHDAPPLAPGRGVELEMAPEGPPALDYEERLDSAFRAQREEAIEAHRRKHWGTALVASKRALLIRPVDPELRAIHDEAQQKAGRGIPRDRRTRLAFALMFLSVLMMSGAVVLSKYRDPSRASEPSGSEVQPAGSGSGSGSGSGGAGSGSGSGIGSGSGSR